MIKNVCILTAGKGTRLGNLTKRINKAILPIEDIGIISKIINLFDKKTKFIIALGFQGDQVKQYLRIMHPSLNFSFVNIKNYEGPLSGPGHSLHCCKKIIKNEPFLFLPVDTLFDKSILKINTNGNFVVGSEKPFNERSQFCNFYIEDSKVKEIIDKKNVINVCHLVEYYLLKTQKFFGKA